MARPAGDDPTSVAGTLYEKVLENERLRILVVTFKPGDKMPMHAHPDHAAYLLAGGKMKIMPATGEPGEFEMGAGQAVFLPAQAHSAENVGSTEIKAVVFEILK